MLKKLLILIGLFFALLPLAASARDASQITDWYIKDFQSEIVVNKDSSIDVTERITADCGNLPDKHGIFRVLPTRYNNNGKFIQTPIKLISITDFNGRPYKYQTSKTNDTLTWKIGDADKTVKGVNYYKIVYQYRNIIRADNPNFDQFYWNLSGNNWAIGIDNFHATVKFPGNFNPQSLILYSGTQGTLTSNEAQFKTIDTKTIDVQSLVNFNSNFGVSLKANFPKGIFTPYQFSFMEKYGAYLWLILPLFFIVLAIVLFLKYGVDPKINKSIVPEFAPPENLDPMVLGRIFNQNKPNPKLVAALLVSLAVRGFLKIEETKTAWYMGGKDYKLTLSKTDRAGLKDYESALLTTFFGANNEIFLSKQRDKLSSGITNVHTLAQKWVVNNGYFEKTGNALSAWFYGIGVFVLVGIPVLGSITLNLWALWMVLIPISILYMILGTYMTKLTIKGAEVNHQTKGLKLYMDTAERYRQQFNEKENIFERFLPYAIMFGITKQWTAKIRQIYGDEYLTSYHPVWFVGSYTTFDTDSFTNSMNSVASAVSSSASSGSGGAGGGGGGGGGGGW